MRQRFEHWWASRRMSAYVDGELDAAERRRFERHADRCPQCGPMRRTLLRLMDELRDLRASPTHSIAPGVIEHWTERERSHGPSAGGEGDDR